MHFLILLNDKLRSWQPKQKKEISSSQSKSTMRSTTLFLLVLIFGLGIAVKNKEVKPEKYGWDTSIPAEDMLTETDYYGKKKLEQRIEMIQVT